MIVTLALIPIVLWFQNTEKIELSKWEKNSILLISLFMSVIAYYWHPLEEYDLYRYHLMIDNFSTFSVLDKIKYLFSRGEYLTMLYFWASSIFSDRSIVQVIPVFLIYLSVLTYLKILFNSEKNKIWIIVIVTLYFLSQFKYLMVVSAFRYWFAIIVFLILLRMLKEQKINQLSLFIPVLIHNSIIIFVGIYYVTKFFKRKSPMIIAIFYGGGFLVGNILKIIYNSPIQGDGIYLTFVRKMILYFTFDSSINNQFILLIFEVLFSFVCFYIFYNKKTDFEKENYYFLYGVLVFTLLSIVNRNLFMRMEEVVRILMLPIFISLVIEENNKYKDTNKVRYLIPVLILCGLAFSGFYIQYRILILDIIPNLVF